MWDPVLAVKRGFAEGFKARALGPGRMRLIIQPIIAIALGVRDGISDARAGRPAYVIALLFDREDRRALLRSGIKQIIKPLVVGVVLDMIFQWFIFKSVRPGIAVLVGALLIGLPYALSRGITNRIASRRYRRRQAPSTGSGEAGGQ